MGSDRDPFFRRAGTSTERAHCPYKLTRVRMQPVGPTGMERVTLIERTFFRRNCIRFIEPEDGITRGWRVRETRENLNYWEGEASERAPVRSLELDLIIDDHVRMARCRLQGTWSRRYFHVLRNWILIRCATILSEGTEKLSLLAFHRRRFWDLWHIDEKFEKWISGVWSICLIEQLWPNFLIILIFDLCTLILQSTYLTTF